MGGPARTCPSSFALKCTLDFQIQWIFKCLLHLKLGFCCQSAIFPFFLPADLSPPCWFTSASVNCSIGRPLLHSNYLMPLQKERKKATGLNADNISNVSLQQHAQVIWSHPYSQQEIEKKKGVNLLYLLLKHNVKYNLSEEGIELPQGLPQYASASKMLICQSPGWYFSVFAGWTSANKTTVQHSFSPLLKGFWQIIENYLFRYCRGVLLH